MKTVFWDVDTQFDFMRPEGKLYVPGAEGLVARLGALTRYARRQGIVRVASVCDHVMSDKEISSNPDFLTTFPPHCLRGTRGQRKIAVTSMRRPAVIPNRPLRRETVKRRVAARREILVEKNLFDVFTNPNIPALLEALDPDRIVVYGVATDVCDAFAIEGFLSRGDLDVAFVDDAAKPIHRDRGEKLVNEWRRRGVEMVRTAEVLAGRLDAGRRIRARKNS